MNRLLVVPAARAVTRLAVLALILAAVVAPASGLAAQPRATVGDLIGLSAAQVRAKIAPVPSSWPIQPSFEIATPNGALTFIEVRTLMKDPVLAQDEFIWRTDGDANANLNFLKCDVRLQHGAVTREGGPTLLMFRNHRFEAAFDTPPSWRQPVDPHRPTRPPLSPFVKRAGGLPLEDGLGFMRRWDRATLAHSDRLWANCAKMPLPRLRPRPRRRGPDAGTWQGLAALPFAIVLPAKNWSRAVARKRGPSLLSTLKVGRPLDTTPERFAVSHRGVVFRRSTDPNYGVLSIDLGGARTRNLSGKRDTALVGVRNGRVEWIGPPGSPSFPPG